MLKLTILVLLLSSIDMTTKAKTTTTKSTKSGKQWTCPPLVPCNCFICPMFFMQDCITDSDCSDNKKCVRRYTYFFL